MSVALAATNHRGSRRARVLNTPANVKRQVFRLSASPLPPRAKAVE